MERRKQENVDKIYCINVRTKTEYFKFNSTIVIAFCNKGLQRLAAVSIFLGPQCSIPRTTGLCTTKTGPSIISGMQTLKVKLTRYEIHVKYLLY